METTARTTSHNSGNSSKGDGAVHKVATTAHAAVDRAAEAADDAARKVKPAIDRAAELAHYAVDKAADVAAPTAEWLGERGESLIASPKKIVDGTRKYVEAHPLKSVAIALVAGLLIARVLR